MLRIFDFSSLLRLHLLAPRHNSVDTQIIQEEGLFAENVAFPEIDALSDGQVWRGGL
jgi:hypothetical protein